MVMMRERTAFPRKVIEALPKLKLLITTGMRATPRSTRRPARSATSWCAAPTSFGNPTTGITFGLMLELTRRIGWENARMKSGELWQMTLGADIEGQTLGILGLGKLGTRAAGVGKAFGMKTIAWSQNLTPEKCKEAGVEYVSKDDLFRKADFVTVHLQLSDRTRGLVTAKELGLMKKTAYVINTSRGPIIDEKALVAALQQQEHRGRRPRRVRRRAAAARPPVPQDGQRGDHPAPGLRQPAELPALLPGYRRQYPRLAGSRNRSGWLAQSKRRAVSTCRCSPRAWRPRNNSPSWPRNSATRSRAT